MQDQPLREKVFRSSGWSLLGSGGRQFFGFLVFVVLSRLLSPKEFGLIAISIALIEMVGAVVRLGITENLVCDPDLNDDRASTAFWLSAIVGAAASLLVIILAPFIAAFFEMPQMENPIRWLAIIPFLQATSSVHEAKLQKDFKYKALAMRTLNATVGSGIISIFMAFMGFGVYSLVFQRVVSVLITNITIWSSMPWMPKMVCRTDTAKEQLRNGGPLLFSSLLGMIKMRVVDLIIGYFLGATAVGYYKIAGKLNDFLVQFAIDPLVSVALPAFSQLQNDKASLRRAYQKMTMLCGLLTFPLFMGTAVLAPEVTVFLFGQQWEPSGALLQILCIAGISSTLDYFFRPLAVAAGRQKLVSAVNFIQCIGMIVAATLGAQISVEAVVAGYVLCASCVTLLTVFFLKKYIGITYGSYVQSFYAPISASLVMAGIIYGIKHSDFAPEQIWLQVIIFSIIGGLLYAAGIYFLFPRYRDRVKDMLLPLLIKFLPPLKRFQ